MEGRPPYEDRGNPLALLAVIAGGERPHPEHAGILREALNRMFDPDPRSRWSMADAAHVLHRLYERHGPAPTRSITHPIEQPAAAAAPVLAPHSFSEPSQEVPEQPQEPDAEPPAEPAAEPLAEPPAEPLAEPPAEEPLPPPDSVDRESTPPARKRRGGPFLLAALALLLVIGGLGAYLLFGSDDNGSPTSAGTESDSSEADPEPETSPSQEPTSETSSPEQTPTATSSEPPSETASPSAAGSAEEFASTYYGYLPDDTSTGWRSLAPSLRASIGRGSYDGFWSTISAVEVEGVEEVEPGVVDVSLVYTNNDGTAEDEVHRLFLEPAGDGYLIVDDEVVG